MTRESFWHLSPPRFAQLVTWFLLAVGLVLACQFYPMHEGPRTGPSSVLSFLPESVRGDVRLFALFRGMLVVGGALWLFQRALPWSCWLTTLGFTGLWSMHVENTWANAHIFHCTNMLLVLQSAWQTLYAREIAAAHAAGTYWTTPLYPRWVYLTGLAYLGLFHTYAGLAKLIYSGPDWANGVSLQLWVHMEGYSWSPTTWLLLSSRTAAKWLQVLTLVAETAGILGLIPRLRVAVGLLLLAFYFGVIVTFPYGFAINAGLVALYFLPIERWLERP